MTRRNEATELDWSQYSQRFATTLRSVRERVGLSQEEVAYRSGLTRYTYQKYEKGKSRLGNPANPTLRTLIAMAQVLAVSVDESIPNAPPDLRAR